MKPAHTLPPITSAPLAPRSGRFRPLIGVAPPSRIGKRITVNTASSNSAADTSSSVIAPMRVASAAVADPVIEPSVPPTPMNPNIRLACSLLNVSAIRHQKIDVLNSANTVVHTKNARAVHTSTTEPSFADKKRNTT